jgi:mono/diheme cytochrome c family protein
MPSWAHLPENDRREMADYILQLNRAGWVDKGLSLGDTRTEAGKYADEMVQPGDSIPIPPEPPQTAQGLRQGRRYYLTVCAKCHGDNGAGKDDPTWRTSEGFPVSSRNLREGVFKGGREGEQLYLRFFTGLPGTPMPAGELPGEQVWRVVQYIQSLSDPEAQELARIRPMELAATRVPQLPSSPDDPIWEAVPEARISLMPLWWRKGYTDAVLVKAVHDGESVAFCLEWNDDTQDLGAVHLTSFPDGAAVQLTASDSPPLFAMGATAEPVNIWHWKAVWEEDARQFQDEGTTFPGFVSDLHLDGEKGWLATPGENPQYFTAVDAGNLIASQQRPSVVEDANAAGFGTLTSQSAGSQNVQGLSRWKDGLWRLQLSRALKGSGASDSSLQTGEAISIAFAVWDGSAGDRDGQKSVSIWSTLRLEP